MVRALYGSYAGPLYSVLRSSDNKSKAIPLLQAGGFADSSAQDDFCRGTHCTVRAIFDQSPRNNTLFVFEHYGRSQPDTAANATADRHIIGGHPVYALFIEPGMGYRTVPGAAKGVAVGAEAETMYMVTSGEHYDNHCCFD